MNFLPQKQKYTVLAKLLIAIVFATPVAAAFVSITDQIENLQTEFTEVMAMNLRTESVSQKQYFENIASVISTQTEQENINQESGLVAGTNIVVNSNDVVSEISTTPQSKETFFSNPAVNGKVLGITTNEFIAAMREVIGAGLPADIQSALKGEKGEKGDAGITLGYTSPTSTNTSSMGIIGGFTHLSGQDFSAQTVNVTQNFTIAAGVTSNFNSNVGIGTNSPGAKLEIRGDGKQLLLTGGALNTDASESWLKVTGTYPVGTSNYAGVTLDFTTITGTNGGQWGLLTDLSAGYTGDRYTIGNIVRNNAAGTGNNLRMSVSGGPPFSNMAFSGTATGVTVGINIGIYTEAGNGSLNIGAGSKAIVAKNSSSNVGVMGTALNTAVTAPVHVAGYFGLQITTPTFENAALIADNGATTSPIFLGRDNGSTLFSIIDGGNVGIGTAAPTSNLHVFKDTGSVNARFEAFGGAGVNGTSSMWLRSVRGTPAAPEDTQSGDLLGALVFLGYDGNQAAGAKIEALAAAEWGSGADISDAPSNLVFYTAPDGDDSQPERMRIDLNGNVGIGTTGPGSGGGKLTVNGDVPIEIHSTFANGVDAYTHSDTNFRGPQLSLSKSRGTQSSPTAVQSGDSLGYINFGGYNSSAYNAGATVEVQASQNWTGSAQGTNMYFKTTNDNTTSTGTKLTILSSGNVGIGTTNPSSARLQVESTSTETFSTIRTTAGDTVLGRMSAVDGGTTGQFAFSYDPGSRLGTIHATGTFSGSLRFLSGATEIMRLDRVAGNVGIGTNNPGVRLDVQDTTIDNNIFRLKDSDGTCDHNPEAGSETVTCSSDERLKTNIVNAENKLEYLLTIQIRDYTVLSSGDQMTGVIAQELMVTHPELVSLGSDGYYKVSEISSWKLVRAIQELNDKVTVLQSNSGQIGQWSIGENGVLVVNEIKTEKLCIGNTCVDEATLKILLENNAALPLPPPPDEEVPDGEVAGESAEPPEDESTEEETTPDEVESGTDIETNNS